MLQKIFLCDLKTRVYSIATGIFTVITILNTGIKPIYANVIFSTSLTKENNFSVPDKHILDRYVDTNDSSLFAESHGNQWRSDPEIIHATDIEISEHGCSVGITAQSKGASFSTYMFFPDLPRQSLSISVPKFGKRTIILESGKSAISESQEVCNQAINSAKEIDIIFRINKFMSNSELETNIQNGWKWKD
ncbi:MAG: hypothetical protein KME30_33470 [Iphinoe sp. HA4291-MV1]|jgi:hypothetical protein|nr:hypothetical protein [Iphinoe sp. HA4291-MV1]